MFGKMSPFLEFTIGSQVKSTGPHTKGGKNPSWAGEVIEMDIIPGSVELVVKVWDYETIKNHDLIG